MLKDIREKFPETLDDTIRFYFTKKFSGPDQLQRLYDFIRDENNSPFQNMSFEVSVKPDIDIYPILKCFQTIKLLQCHESQFYMKNPEIQVSIENIHIRLFGKNSDQSMNYPKNLYFIQGLKRIRCKNFNCGLNLVPLDAENFPLLEEVHHLKENNSNIKQNLFNVFIPNGYLTNTKDCFQELRLDFGPMSVLNDFFMMRQLSKCMV